MNKKTALLSGLLAIFGVIATVGIIASTETETGGMIKKKVTEMPENRTDYQMTDEELAQLEQELKAGEEAAPAADMMEEESMPEETMPEAVE